MLVWKHAPPFPVKRLELGIFSTEFVRDDENINLRSGLIKKKSLMKLNEKVTLTMTKLNYIKLCFFFKIY